MPNVTWSQWNNGLKKINYFLLVEKNSIAKKYMKIYVRARTFDGNMNKI